MSVVEINVVDSEALQRLLTGLHDIFRRAVDVPHSRSNAELGREEDFVSLPGALEPVKTPRSATAGYTPGKPGTVSSPLAD